MHFFEAFQSVVSCLGFRFLYLFFSFKSVFFCFRFALVFPQLPRGLRVSSTASLAQRPWRCFGPGGLGKRLGWECFLKVALAGCVFQYVFFKTFLV